MGEFKIDDLVVVIKGEFDGQTGYVSSLVPTAGVIEVTLDNSGYRALLDPTAVSKQH